MDILVLGVNGFIGSHLTTAVLTRTDWRVFGMDLDSDRVAKWLDHPRFRRSHRGFDAGALVMARALPSRSLATVNLSRVMMSAAASSIESERWLPAPTTTVRRSSLRPV